MTTKQGIEAELQAATEISKKRGEDQADYINRLLDETEKLDEKEWNALSVPAQDWYNNTVDAIKAKKPIPPFDEVEDEEAAEPAEAAPKTNGHAKPAKASKSAAKDAKAGTRKIPVKPKQKERTTVTSAGKVVTMSRLLKHLVIKHPDMSVDDLMIRLEKKGLKPSKYTAATIRSDTRDTLRALNDLNMLKIDV